MYISDAVFVKIFLFDNLLPRIKKCSFQKTRGRIQSKFSSHQKSEEIKFRYGTVQKKLSIKGQSESIFKNEIRKSRKFYLNYMLTVISCLCKYLEAQYNN